MFRAIDPHRWEVCGENPVRLLQEVSSEALAQAAGDAGLIARAAELEDAFAADLRRPSVGPIAPGRPVAFLCAEFGVHHSLPVYSGGLGALAGDLVKRLRTRRFRWWRWACCTARGIFGSVWMRLGGNRSTGSRTIRSVYRWRWCAPQMESR